MKKVNRKKRKNKKKFIFGCAALLLTLIVVLVFFLLNRSDRKLTSRTTNYSDYYSKYVLVKEDASIYELIDNKFQEKGTIYAGAVLELEEVENTNTEYFKIKDLDAKYYIKYNSITKSDNYPSKDLRYKNYIPFNENIVTKDETTFYNEENKLYTINQSFNLPIIIKDDDKYYVEYNEMLLSVLASDVLEVVNNHNTDLEKTDGVPVLNYHFVYKPEEETCNQEICHPESQFREHLSYIKDNGYFTITMSELEKYIDGQLQLPKSVVITIDDGRNVNLATQILEEYQLNATAFIVTSRYNIGTAFIKSEYVELQSHSHNLHNAGTCPAGHGQGGGLTCLEDDVILEDLKTSRELLGGAIAFCYPFYEYNSHAIELLKEAGFHLGFAGEYAGGKTKAEVDIDKFRIPRWVIVNWTSEADFISYVSGTV